MQGCMKLFLLILINFSLITNIFSEQNSDYFSFTQINTESITIQLSNNKQTPQNLLLIIRNMDNAQIAPKIENRYLTSNTYINSNNESFSGEGNLVIYQKDSPREFSVADLLPDTYYYIDAYTIEKKQYKLLSSTKFTTLATPPSSQVQKIMWKNQTAKSFEIVASGSDSKSTLITISTKHSDFTPQNGIDYKSSSSLGMGEIIGDSNFVVLSASDTVNYVRITNLTPDTQYYIKAFAVNGKDKSCNYLTDLTKLNNSILLPTLLESPKILKFENKEQGECSVEWTKVLGAVSYYVELALDSEFNEPDEVYDRVDVGDVTKFDFEDLQPNKTYYVRIAAIGKLSVSEYSNVMSKKM